MSYCFRIRFNLPGNIRIGVDSLTWLLTRPETEPAITLRSADQDAPIKDGQELVLIGEKFDTKEDAETAAERWLNAMMLAFSLSRIGADFGDRAAQGGFTE